MTKQPPPERGEQQPAPEPEKCEWCTNGTVLIEVTAGTAVSVPCQNCGGGSGHK